MRRFVVSAAVGLLLVAGLSPSVFGQEDPGGGGNTARTIESPLGGAKRPKWDFTGVTLGQFRGNGTFKLNEEAGKAAFKFVDGETYIRDMKFVRWATMARPRRTDTGAVYRVVPTPGTKEVEMFFFFSITPFKQRGKPFHALCYAFKDEDRAYTGWFWMEGKKKD